MEAPKILDNWKIWISLAGILTLVAYIPVLNQFLQVSPFGSPGYDPNILVTITK